MAVNILNGYHIKEYVAFHERLQRGAVAQTGKNDDTRDYLEWLAQKEEHKKAELDDYRMFDDD